MFTIINCPTRTILYPNSLCRNWQWDRLTHWEHWPFGVSSDTGLIDATLGWTNLPLADSPQLQGIDYDMLSEHDSDTISGSHVLLWVSAWSACNCPCCMDHDIAHHPKDLIREIQKCRAAAELTCQVNTTQLVYEAPLDWTPSSYKVFCLVCCSAQTQGLSTSSKHYHLCFVESYFFQLE